MKRGFLVAGIVFGVALAVIVGLRLDQAGLAVLVGVVCGIVAGLPISLVLLYSLSREREARQRQEERRWPEERPAVAPPVFILNAGRGAEPQPHFPLLAENRPRDFVIVGEAEDERTEGARTTGKADRF